MEEIKKIRELLRLQAVTLTGLPYASAKILTAFLSREGKAFLRWKLAGGKDHKEYVAERWGSEDSSWLLFDHACFYLRNEEYADGVEMKITTPGLKFAKDRIELTKSQLDVLRSPHGVYHDKFDIKLMIILGYMRGGYFGGRHVTEAGREYMNTFPDPNEGKVDELVKEIIQKKLEQDLARLTTGITPSLCHEKKPFHKCVVKNEGAVAEVFMAKMADISSCAESIDLENIELCTPAVKTLSVESYGPPTGLVTLSNGRVHRLHPEQIAKFEAMVMETPDLITPPTNDVSITSYSLSTGEMMLNDSSTLTINPFDLSVTVSDLPASDSGMGGGLPPCEKQYDGSKDGDVLRYNQGTGEMQWFDPFKEKKEEVTTAKDEVPMRKLTITMVEDHKGVTWEKEVVSRGNPSGREFLEQIYPNLQIDLSIAQVAEGQYTVTELDQDGPIHFGFLYVEEETID